MIIVKLQGGLGNQMFQYAVARSLVDEKQPIYLDLSFLEMHHVDTETFSSRNYELNIFPYIRARRINSGLIKILKSRSMASAFESFFIKIRQDKNELIDFSFLRASSLLYLDGYFQSEIYFRTSRERLLREFRFPELDEKNNKIKHQITSSEASVSVHFRRGDYLRSPVVTEIHGVLPASYHLAALKTLNKKYGEISLFVFSDDIEWVKDNFDWRTNTTFVSGNKGRDSWKDMSLMTHCKHHIIANSSFSWWGAWLSQKHGDIFAPANWFNPKKVEFNIHNLIPENWTVIP